MNEWMNEMAKLWIYWVFSFISISLQTVKLSNQSQHLHYIGKLLNTRTGKENKYLFCINSDVSGGGGISFNTAGSISTSVMWKFIPGKLPLQGFCSTGQFMKRVWMVSSLLLVIYTIYLSLSRYKLCKHIKTYKFDLRI